MSQLPFLNFCDSPGDETHQLFLSHSLSLSVAISCSNSKNNPQEGLQLLSSARLSLKSLVTKAKVSYIQSHSLAFKKYDMVNTTKKIMSCSLCIKGA